MAEVSYKAVTGAIDSPPRMRVVRVAGGFMLKITLAIGFYRL